ncbi:MAG: hypothetical protein HY313_00180 [Acidobacteria bacterium]|nr:hypothetical protein [Acidobacteriota bacterium]
MRSGSQFQPKKFWITVGLGASALLAGGFWSLRSIERSQIRNLLNEQIGFRSPALEVTFSRRVIANSASQELLQPGVRQGLWTLHHRQGPQDSLEVQLTERGHRFFSVVGRQILATFQVGTREVTRVIDLQRSSGSRKVRFRYEWKSLHQNIAVLGVMAPELHKEYEGEALLLQENDQWKVLHWTTPQLDDVVARFRALKSAPGDGI